ncbi:MAG: MarC family protein [Bacteroidota bacterium]
MKEFLLCFVPLFVAVDVVGVLPMFIGLTAGIERCRIHRIIYQSVLTATAVALAFLVAGKAIMQFLGISIADFMVAGGLLLFIISITDLVTTEKILRRVDPETWGAVPLGVPLIAGPAVLTSSILLLNEHGIAATASAIIANMLIAGIVLRFAGFVSTLFGNVGLKILSKIASLLLATIGVMIARKGIVSLISGGF